MMQILSFLKRFLFYACLHRRAGFYDLLFQICLSKRQLERRIYLLRRQIVLAGHHEFLKGKQIDH
jgi:hypothetical protein